HKKIDPLGFALENFDATGQWRTQYESGHRIESSGRMPDGKTFKNLDGLKKIMASDLRQFSRNLCTKLLTYATGRTMEVSDRPEIDRLVELSLENKIGLKDLLRVIVTSEIFLSK
ncbi:MAG: DUF1585 domain-containing protein, partial [Opitutae bacterium]|nr:DUF1585 domain-containing protein [Opitutae bacterium]